MKSNKSRNSTKKEASREKCGPESVAKIGKSKRLGEDDVLFDSRISCT